MFSDPQKVIEQCGIQAGMEIADLGVGSGFYAVAAAMALISTGRVYAVDVQKDLLTKLKNSVVAHGIYNLETIWGDIEKPSGTHLREGSIDFAILANILFQLEDKQGAINEVKRILKPGGRVLVVDWSESLGNIGPHPKKVVTQTATQDLFEKNGFHVDKEVSAGSHHYGMIMKKM